MDRNLLIAEIIADESFSPTAYWDVSRWSWGYGTLAPGEGATITKEKAVVELEREVDRSIAEYNWFFSGVPVSEVRQRALANLIYNIGRSRFQGFAKLITAVHEQDWGHAAYEAFDSKWFRQLRKRGDHHVQRSERIVLEILTGEKL